LINRVLGLIGSYFFGSFLLDGIQKYRSFLLNENQKIVFALAYLGVKRTLFSYNFLGNIPFFIQKKTIVSYHCPENED